MQVTIILLIKTDTWHKRP